MVLVLDVPAAPAELPSRTAQLADEFGRLIAHSVPGVRARKAVVSTGAPAGPVRPPNGLRIDRVNRDVHIDGHPVRLTYREFELLCYLAAVPRRPVTRAELIREVWHDRPPGAGTSYRTVDTHSEGFAPNWVNTPGCSPRSAAAATDSIPVLTCTTTAGARAA